MTKFRRFNIFSIIDPLHSKTYSEGDAKLYRHRFTAGLILGAMICLAGIVIVASCFLPHGDRGLHIVRILFAFVGFGALLSIYVLRALDQRVLATNIFIIFVGLALIYLAAMTGGILSPAAICLIIIPVIATLSIDSFAGKIWGVLAFLTWTLLFFAPQLGFEIQKTMPTVDDSFGFYVSIVVSHLFIAFVAFYYEGTSKTLRQNLIKERREYHYLANHDTHTGVINRRHFLEILTSAIDSCEKSGESFCLFFIDLNDFKKANDEYGHHFGDQILEVFARRLRHRTRATDTVARIGGDEFCIISRDMKSEEDAICGERRFVAILQEPMSLSEGSYTLKASIGWSIYPVHGKDHEALLKHADQQMYEAKRRKNEGRN